MFKNGLVSSFFMSVGTVVYAQQSVKVELIHFNLDKWGLAGKRLCSGELKYDENETNAQHIVNTCEGVGEIPVDITLYAGSGDVNTGRTFAVGFIIDGQYFQNWSSTNNSQETSHSIRMNISVPTKWTNGQDDSNQWLLLDAEFVQVQVQE